MSNQCNQLIRADTDLERMAAQAVAGMSSSATRRVYAGRLRAWLSTSPQLSREGVQQYVGELRSAGAGSSVIIQVLSAIKLFVKEAEARNLLDRTTAQSIYSLSAGKRKGVRAGNWLTEEEADRLINSPRIGSTNWLRDRALLALMVGCGLRRAEVSRLSWDRLQQRWGRWVLADIVGKGDRVRTVAVPGWVADRLLAYRLEQEQELLTGYGNEIHAGEETAGIAHPFRVPDQRQRVGHGNAGAKHVRGEGEDGEGGDGDGSAGSPGGQQGEAVSGVRTHDSAEVCGEGQPTPPRSVQMGIAGVGGGVSSGGGSDNRPLPLSGGGRHQPEAAGEREGSVGDVGQVVAGRGMAHREAPRRLYAMRTPAGQLLDRVDGIQTKREGQAVREVHGAGCDKPVNQTSNSQRGHTAEDDGEAEGKVFRLTVSGIWWIVKQRAGQAGITCPLSPHDLRRTYAALAKKGGADIRQIQAELGHASVQTTERYLGMINGLRQGEAAGDHIRLT